MTGSGCPAGQTVTLSIAGTPVGTVTADPRGRFHTIVQLPSLPIGRHIVDVRCGGRLTSLPIDLVVSTQAITTPFAASTVGLVLLFIVLGALFVLPTSPMVKRARKLVQPDGDEQP